MSTPDQDPETPGDTWGLDIMTRVLANHRKVGDDVLFSDEDLLKHVDGSQPFDEEEWRQVLASPLTMRRMNTISDAYEATKPAQNAQAKPDSSDDSGPTEQYS